MRWTCHGSEIEPHSPEENEEGLTCGVCGKEKPDKPDKPPVRGFPVSLAIASIILLLSGGAIYTQSDKIDFICRPLGNCESFGNAFKTATSLANDAEKEMSNAKNVEDLKKAESLFIRSNQIISSASIPNTSPIFGRVKQLMVDNKKMIETLALIAKKEIEAKDALQRSMSKASEADKLGKASQSLNIEQLANQQKILSEAASIAKTISEKSFLKLEKNKAIQTYQDKIASIQKDIYKLQQAILIIKQNSVIGDTPLQEIESDISGIQPRPSSSPTTAPNRDEWLW